MSQLQLPAQEAPRLDALYQYEVLDTPPEALFDDLACLAAHVCCTPIALINFIDRNRQCFKASIGLTVSELPRDVGFCSHAILQHELLIVPDACQDIRFADNPLVTKEPHIRFYAGVPLITPAGQAIGTLCVMDQQSRLIDRKQAEALSMLARQVLSQLESRRRLIYSACVIAECRETKAVLQQSEAKLKAIFNSRLQAVVLIDRNHKIQAFNKTANEWVKIIYGRELKEGNSIYDFVHQEHLEDFNCGLKTAFKGELVKVEKLFKGIERSEHWFEIEYSPVFDDWGLVIGVCYVIINIDQRKTAVQQIQASLKEKEFLLQEIHHRVKNNLQVISSLLNLQSGYIKDQQALESFKESQSRIKSIALLHEKLYQSKNLSQLNFAEYIQQLAFNLFRAYGVNSSAISLKIHVEDVLLDVNTAITCGLIINELVSNCIKHAFPAGKSGKIYILLLRVPEQDNKLILCVRDNGVGFPKYIDFRNSESLGLQLVNTLAAQLKGNLELNCNGITEFKIEFIFEKSQ